MVSRLTSIGTTWSYERDQHSRPFVRIRTEKSKNSVRKGGTQRGKRRVLATTPRPADSVQRHPVDVDKEAHKCAPEDRTYQQLLKADRGVHDAGPDSQAQGYGEADADWRHHILVYHNLVSVTLTATEPRQM